MKTVQSIAFDFSVHGVTPRIYGKQGDVNSRFVNISLFDQGAAWLVPDGALLSIRFRTPSGASGLYDTLSDGSSAFEVSDNTVCVALAEPIFAESGPVRCELSISAAGAGVTTWCFVVAVEGASVSDKEIPEDYYNGFLSVAAQVAADAKRAEDAANSVDASYLIPLAQKGAANGVASLDSSGKVPSGQLPSMDYIPTSQKGAANGVAPLTGNSKIDGAYLPELSSSVNSTSTTTPANSYAVKLAYDKASSANITVKSLSGILNDEDNDSSMEFYIRKQGKVSTVLCKFMKGSSISDWATFTFPPDALGCSSGYGSFPNIICSLYPASGTTLVGYADVKLNNPVTVQIHKQYFDTTNNFKTFFTIISDV